MTGGPGTRSRPSCTGAQASRFQLANRFIGLLAAGERPSSILAATFTRKAAGEILERTQGSVGWALFYGLFVLAAAMGGHARDPDLEE